MQDVNIGIGGYFREVDKDSDEIRRGNTIPTTGSAYAAVPSHSASSARHEFSGNANFNAYRGGETNHWADFSVREYDGKSVGTIQIKTNISYGYSMTTTLGKCELFGRMVLFDITEGSSKSDRETLTDEPIFDPDVNRIIVDPGFQEIKREEDDTDLELTEIVEAGRDYRVEIQIEGFAHLGAMSSIGSAWLASSQIDVSDEENGALMYDGFAERNRYLDYDFV
jgi:hypothetical protein